MKATVSVVMCTCNGERYVREQLDSILSQTWPLHEVIVQDDCSTDTTPDIISSYAARDPRIRFFRNAERLGFNRNYQSACQRATGQFVAISDQDDVWLPEKIARQVEAIGDHDLCFSAHLRGADRQHTNVVSPQYSLEALLFQGFAGHTMLLRTDLVQQPDAWLPRFYYDWSLAVAAQLRNGIVRLDEPLNWHRSHEASAARSQQARFFPKVHERPTWQPYVLGLGSYRRLQRKPQWQQFYRHVVDHTADGRQPLAHRLSRLMLSRRPSDLLRLCRLCMKHRTTIYPDPSKAQGLRGRIRSFCYPFIFAYHNTTFDLDR